MSGTDVGADAAADAGGREALGLAREVGVARGALDVGMAQQLADHAQALAGGERAARIGVAEVVDAHVIEAGVGAEAIPVCGDGGEVGAGLLADDDPGVVRHTLNPRQHGLCGGCEGHHAGAGLAVAQAKLASGAVDIVPAEGEDLVEPAAGEHEQPQRRDGVGRDRALHARFGLCLGLRECHTQPAVLLAGEEALALLLLIFAHAPAGVGAVRREAPGRGEGEHLGEHRERAVGGTGCLPQAVVERRHVGGLDHGERHHAERGQDVVLERAPVDAGGVGVAVDCDVGAQVAGCEVCDGGAGLGGRRCGLLAPLDAVDDLGGALAGLGGGELAVGAEGDAPGPALGPALDHVDLAPRGVDPDAEAGQLAVPEDPVPLLDRETVHRPAAQRKPATARHRRHIPRAGGRNGARMPSSRERAAASPRKSPASPARLRKHRARGLLHARGKRALAKLSLVEAVIAGWRGRVCAFRPVVKTREGRLKASRRGLFISVIKAHR